MSAPILVFGADGRVGGAVFDAVEAGGLGPLWRPVKRAEVDIKDREQVRQAIADSNARAVVNLAACALPAAQREDMREEAVATNVIAVRRMAALCGALAIPMVHISTDCVFDGEKASPYIEDDVTAPCNHYGATKLGGERWVREHAASHIIIRTTGVYLRGRPNFLETVLQRARNGDALEIVSDSVYTPTDARELANAICIAAERVIADPGVSGTYHFAGPDVMSYVEFADMVLTEAAISAPIHPVTMAEREPIDGFKRPRNAALDSKKFAKVFGLRHRPTRECVSEVVNPAR